MELVASFKYKRANALLGDGHHYIDNILEVLDILSNNIDTNNIKLDNNAKSDLYIVINSNLGLCASFNNDIYKFISTLIKKDDVIVPIGLKGFNHYKILGYKIINDFVNITSHNNDHQINQLMDYIYKEYNAHKYKNVYLIYTRFINTLTYKPTLAKLLPLEINKSDNKKLLSPIIEPSAEVLLKELEPIYFSSLFHLALIESEVSEQASRKQAMNNATKNADDLLDKLKLEYNKARQGAITQEITEVVSGASDNL